MQFPLLKKIKIKNLLEVTSEYFDVSISDIIGKKRIQHIADIRMIVMYLARECLCLSFPVIGESIGNRDHTTAMHAHRQVTNKIKEDAKLTKDIIYLISTLLNFAEENNFTIDSADDTKILEEKIQKPETDLVRIEIDKLLSRKISVQKPKRQGEIFDMWNNGDSFDDISKKYELSRQRINQIVEQAILLEAQKLIKEGFVLDIKEFIKDKKKQHTKKLKTRKGYGAKQKPIKQAKIKRWSEYYDKCRMCNNIKNKHHSHGYCRKCYTKSEMWKESVKKYHLKHRDKILKKQREYAKDYNRRPEIALKRKIEFDLKNYGGNRENTLKRDNYSCQKCGLTQEDSFKKYKKDLFVIHRSEKNNHSLLNLITLCNGCFTKERFHKK